MPRAKVRDDITKEVLEKCLQENMSVLEMSIELHANYGTIAKKAERIWFAAKSKKSLYKIRQRTFEQISGRRKEHCRNSETFRRV